ncbi:calmodulin-dependent protein kinase [Pelomyxa schiedti]|nr:calmodulin-dependent protein kinase [Pelomyxa schiedti]
MEDLDVATQEKLFDLLARYFIHSNLTHGFKIPPLPDPQQKITSWQHAATTSSVKYCATAPHPEATTATRAAAVSPSKPASPYSPHYATFDMDAYIRNSFSDPNCPPSRDRTQVEIDAGFTLDCCGRRVVTPGQFPPVASVGILNEGTDADAGNTQAMSDLARRYLGERGVVPNLDEALRLYTTARDGPGLFLVGREYYKGGSSGVDKAVSAWSMAADLGDRDAMVALGWCYQHGVGVECDKPRAASIYASITKPRGYTWRVGVCYLRGEGVERDWAKAVAIFQEISEARVAQAYLGWCYLWGCGVGRDVAKGVQLLNGAAAGLYGSDKAKVFLGYCHERGIGVQLNTKKARELFKEVASHFRGQPEALGELGEYCERGDCGAPTDKRAAVGYYQMGADAGDPVSMFHLGVCLRDGVGVDCNVEQSHNWLVKAAKLGHRGATKSLAEIPSGSNNGRNIPPLQRQVGTLEKLVEEHLLEETLHSEETHKISSLKKQLEDAEARILSNNLTESLSHLKAQNEILAEENARLNTKLSILMEESQKEKERMGQMISLIPADMSDFTPEKLLGTGASAAAFKVGFSTGGGLPTTQSSMVMKVLFNWENTPRHTRLRQKYMTECVILSSMTPHPNVIQPLGALVIPRLPDEFIEQIPASQSVFREMALNKSLAFIMPFGGIPLSSFLQSLLLHPSSKAPLPPWEMTLKTFQQALKAVNHIEINKIVHRDIKEDNLLVDPATNTLSLIDFGEAKRCPRADLEVTMSSEDQLWGNTGTMPPEVSTLARTLRANGTSPFSYSKCDSFALAITFYDALLPTNHKFIGSTLNNNMATFAPAKLLALFPLPDPHPLPPSPSSSTSSTTTPRSSNKSIPQQMKEVLVQMMASDKNTRMSSSDAIQFLSSLSL